MKTLNAINGGTLMEAELKPPDFVVDTLLATGLHILAGSPKVGKSRHAVSVAKGESVWGMATKQGATLCLCLEDADTPFAVYARGWLKRQTKYAPTTPAMDTQTWLAAFAESSLPRIFQQLYAALFGIVRLPKSSTGSNAKGKRLKVMAGIRKRGNSCLLVVSMGCNPSGTGHLHALVREKQKSSVQNAAKGLDNLNCIVIQPK